LARKVISTEEPAVTTVEACRPQLKRILESSDFRATPRKHRFLQYIVDEELAGRGSRIKAYSIGLSAFGREVTFDPQSDPVVRIEASDLRRSLERYYSTAGRFDPILIAIPKGRYVPTFTARDANAASGGSV
jgi:adenylate cyclase